MKSKLCSFLYTDVLAEEREKDDHVVIGDDGVLIVAQYFAFATIILWKAIDGLDQVA